jgi:hypothetical protein
MREQRTSVNGVEIGTIFQFQKIVSAIGSSFHPARLIVSLLMVLVLLASGSLWDSISTVDASALGTNNHEELLQSRAVAIAQAATSLGHIAPEDSNTWTAVEAQAYMLSAWEEFVFEGDVQEKDRIEFTRLFVELERVRRRGSFEASATYVIHQWNTIVNAGVALDLPTMWSGVVSILWDLPQLLWNQGYHWFISLYGLLLVYVLCIGGGAIARMEICWHGQSHRLSVGEAFDYSLGHWRQLLAAVLAPAMIVASIAVFLMLMGLVLLSVPWLNFIGAILYGFALLLGFLVAVIAVGYATCFPLLIPATIAEGCGGEESIQRAFSYVISQTLRYLVYVLIVLISLVVGYVLVELIANLTLRITANLVDAGTLNDSLRSAGVLQQQTIPAVGLAWYESGAGYVIHFWETIIRCLVAGWVFSGFFSMSTMVYLLMRKACDNRDTLDVCASE